MHAERSAGGEGKVVRQRRMPPPVHVGERGVAARERRREGRGRRPDHVAVLLVLHHDDEDVRAPRGGSRRGRRLGPPARRTAGRQDGGEDQQRPLHATRRRRKSTTAREVVSGSSSQTKWPASSSTSSSDPSMSSWKRRAIFTPEKRSCAPHTISAGTPRPGTQPSYGSSFSKSPERYSSSCRMRSSVVANAFQYSSTASSPMPLDTWPIMASKPSRVNASISFSPSPGVRIVFARSCQRRSAKKPPSDMTRARTAPGWSQAQRRPTITPQSCTTSTTSSSPRAARKRSSDSTCASQVPGSSPGGESP